MIAVRRNASHTKQQWHGRMPSSPGDLPHLVRTLCSELYSDDIVATVASITINVCRSQIERRDNAAVGPQ